MNSPFFNFELQLCLNPLSRVLICDYRHPPGKKGEHSPPELPAALIEERKH